MLFRNLAAFGQLTTARTLFAEAPSPAKLAAAQLRCTWFAGFLQLLERSTGLRFGHARLAYCRTGDSWEPSLPAGGWTDAAPAPLPSQVVTSMARSWSLAGSGARQTQHTGTDAVSSGLAPPTSVMNPLRACLWICQTRGLESALTYLLDLEEAGVMVDGRRLVDLVLLLLFARCQVSAEAELVERFFGGTVPSDHAAWSTAPIGFEWIRVDGIANAWHVGRFTFDTLRMPVVPEIVQPLVMRMVEDGLQAVEAVRVSANWDQWLLAQFSLGVRLEATLQALAHTVPRPSLALRSIISQFQEIRADVGALANGLWRDPNLPSFEYGPPALLFAQVARRYQAAVGAGWQERLFDERVLAPRALKSVMLDRTTSEVPSEWNALSWRLAYPFAMTLRPHTHAAWRWDESETELSVEAIALPATPLELTRVPFDTAALSNVPAIQQAFHQFAITDTNIQSTYLRWIFGGLEQKSVGADQLSEASYALAGTADQTAMTWPQRFTGLDPDLVHQMARTIVRYDVCAVLMAIRTTLCERNVTDILASSTSLLERHEFSQALAVLDSSLEVYCWNPKLHFQRAVVLNVLDRPAEALESLRAAIVLDEQAPHHWELLGATLLKLGRNLEAAFATSMGEVTRSRGLSYAQL